MEERNSVSVACVGLVRAMPPNLAGRAKRSRSNLFDGGLPVSMGCRDQFGSDDHFKGQKAWANAGHSASEVARSTCWSCHE